MFNVSGRETNATGQAALALEDARFTTVFSRVHPIEVFRPLRNAQGLVSAEDLLTLAHGTRVKVVGLTIMVNTPPIRNGGRAMFVTVEDETGLIDIAVFGRIQERTAKTIMTSRLLGIEGLLQRAGSGGRAVSVNAERILWPWTGSLVKMLEKVKMKME